MATTCSPLSPVSVPHQSSLSQRRRLSWGGIASSWALPLGYGGWGQGVARTPRQAGRVRTHGQIWHAVPYMATTYNALSPLSACQCVHARTERKPRGGTASWATACRPVFMHGPIKAGTVYARTDESGMPLPSWPHLSPSLSQHRQEHATLFARSGEDASWPMSMCPASQRGCRRLSPMAHIRRSPGGWGRPGAHLAHLCMDPHVLW